VEEPPEPQPPMAQAMEWVAKITAVGLEMVLPGLGGEWLDRYFGTKFLVFLGFGFGLTIGITHLLMMTGSLGRKNHNGPPPSDRDTPS
jgi:hypothetical protein